MSTPLHAAAHGGLDDVVAALLDAGAEVDAREAASGATPLHRAAAGGHTAIVRALIDRGAALEARDGWHDLTPLGWATVVAAPAPLNDRPGSIAALGEAGALVDPFVAIALDDAELLRARVAEEPGALARRLGFVDRALTPLHLAVALRRRALVELALALGADPRARTAWGQTPRDLAAAVGDTPADPAIDDLLAATGPDAPLDHAIRTARLFACAHGGQAPELRSLCAVGADVDARQRHLVGEQASEVAPLHLAAAAGHLDAVHVLLDAGAAPRGGASPGVATALHLAAGGGHTDVVLALLDAGADATLRDAGSGATAGGWARLAGHADVARLLDAAASSSI